MMGKRRGTAQIATASLGVCADSNRHKNLLFSTQKPALIVYGTTTQVVTSSSATLHLHRSTSHSSNYVTYRFANCSTIPLDQLFRLPLHQLGILHLCRSSSSSSYYLVRSFARWPVRSFIVFLVRGLLGWLLCFLCWSLLLVSQLVRWEFVGS